MCGSASITRTQSPAGLQLAVMALLVCISVSMMGSGAEAAAKPPAPGDFFVRDGRTYMRSNAGTYCGSRLSEALKLMCNGHYNSYFKVKKQPGTFEDRNSYRVGRVKQLVEQYWSPPAQMAPLAPLPFRERLRAAALLEGRPRFRRGVFDECCSKSCTMDELMSYCEKRD